MALGIALLIEPSPSERSLLSRTKGLLEQYDLRARKGLGQHFLVNSGVLKTIDCAAELSPSDLVVEIGPGIGVLTRDLVRQAGWVIAIEVDAKLAEMVKETILPYNTISIVNRNVLEVEPLDIIREEENKFPPTINPHKYKLVANLPYYITQPIIRHFCEAKLKPQAMVVMVQKEVAQNIVAQPGDLSILAVSVQYYGKPEIVAYVPARSFYPVPKVDSAILKITMYPEPLVKVAAEKSFFKIVRAGFCARRKQVVNALAQGLDIPKAEVLSLMQKAGVSPQKRAETLALEEWARLEKIFTQAEKI